MINVNKIILIGCVGKDAETNVVGSSKVTNIVVATSEGGFKTKNGKDIPERTQWHNVKVWNNDFIEANVKKGTRLYVEGRLEYRTYEKEGQKHMAVEIISDKVFILDGKKGLEGMSPEMKEATGLLNDTFGAVPDGNLPF